MSWSASRLRSHYRSALLFGASLWMCMPMPAHAGGDLDAGRARSAVCAGCHGVAGVTTNPAWPNLAGQNYKYLVKRLKDFRDGEREDEVMSAMAKPLSDRDVENLATYFASLPLRAPRDR